MFWYGYLWCTPSIFLMTFVLELMLHLMNNQWTENSQLYWSAQLPMSWRPCACHLINQLRPACWVSIPPTKWVALFVFCFEMKEINGKGDIIKIWISILGHHCRDMAIVIIPDDWREWSLSWEQSFPKNLQEQMSVCVMSECTALLGQRSGFGWVLDSGFSSCAAPTY